MKVLVVNKKARFNYFLIDAYEAGIVLTGTEVKSLLSHNVNLDQGYILIRKGECFLLNCHIANYDHGNQFNVDNLRTRKLLLHKQQIKRLSLKLQQEKFHMIPTKFYLSKNKIKLEFYTAKVKKLHDKRETLKERDLARKMAQLRK